MKTSQTIAKLSAAMLQMPKIRHPRRSSANPALHNKFADLGEVIDTVRPAFAAAGIVLVQAVDTKPTEDGADVVVTVTTRIVHAESGEWMQATAAIRAVHGMANASTHRLPGMNHLQAVGSAITYLRRYSLSAIAGVASEPDCDGNEASAPAKRPAKKPVLAPRTSAKKPEPKPTGQATPPAPKPATPPPSAEKQAAAPENTPPIRIPTEIPSDRIAGKALTELSNAQVDYLLAPLDPADPAGKVNGDRLGAAWSQKLTQALRDEKNRRTNEATK